MSEFLPVYVQNALEDNAGLLPAVASARPQLKEVLAFCANYRVAGIGALFLSGEGADLRRRLSQSGRAFAHYLSREGVALPLLSQAQPFFDAVAAGDFEAARLISSRLRRGWVRGEEYEEDHLFPEYLMQRFFLGADPATCAGLLDRWERALQGAEDLRLPVCRALGAGDAAAFDEAFPVFLAQERADLEELAEMGMGPEAAATERHLSVVGLALVRLAESAALPVADEYPGIPSLAREGGRVAFPADGWRDVGA